MDVSANRTRLEELYRETLRRLHPSGAVMRNAIAQLGYDFTAATRLHCIAIGKASVPMAAAMLEWCGANKREVVGGVCVSHDDGSAVRAPLELWIGDHPTPGAQSAAAADGLAQYIAKSVQKGDHVCVLLSGGTSALIGAPREGIDADVFIRGNDALLGAGIGIDAINAVRRRLGRWSDGRLGDAIQDRGATAEVFVISDVLDGGVGVVGSGPCMTTTPDQHAARSAVSDSQSGETAYSQRLREALAVADLADTQLRSETSRGPIVHRVVSDSLQAIYTVAKLARDSGFAANAVVEPLTDDVHACATIVARALLNAKAQRDADATPNAHGNILIWRGEPTVTLPAHDAPRGGRMQALALLVARELNTASDRGIGIFLLAAGTDGRDGATDAAGAVISQETWATIVAAGRRPDQDVASWNSTAALRSAGALIPAFSTGTNVNDLMIGVIA
jgi:glycerate 2-kinase